MPHTCRAAIEQIGRYIWRFLASRTFIVLILGLFVLQAIFIALTQRYPLAFDENFHFGIIQIYSGHLLPFLDKQPSDAAIYGSVSRDPSYLYHYLMSFPYRVLAHFFSSQTTQILLLRCINIGFALGSLVIFYKLLGHAPIGRRSRALIIFAVSALPIFPLLAGQINYDNLLLLLVAWVFLMTVSFLEALHQGEWRGRLLAGIFLVAGLTSLVKYAALPIIAALLVYVLVAISLHMSRKTGFWQQRVSSLKTQSWQLTTALLVGFCVVGGLMFERYGINTVRYHTPIPDCAVTLSVDECMSYAPWARDYVWGAANVEMPRASLTQYSSTWLRQLMKEFFFGVYSKFERGSQVVDYWGSSPVPVLINTGWVVLIIGLVHSLVWGRKLWRQYTILRLSAGVIIIYAASLFVQNYNMYREVAVAVAIHGRYVLPILPLILLWFFVAIRETVQWVGRRYGFGKHAQRSIALCAGLIVLLVFTQGGGMLTYFLRGDNSFAWPDSKAAHNAHFKARELAQFIVVGE